MFSFQKIVFIKKERREDDVIIENMGQGEAVVARRAEGAAAARVERPLRLNFQASEERIARLEEEKGFQAIAQSRKKGAAAEKELALLREAVEILERLTL